MSGLIVERPRLTGMLRALTLHGQQFDIEKEIIERKQQLVERRKQARDVGGGKRLTWSQDFASYSDSKAETTKMRGVFQSLLEAVKTILGDDEVPTEEVQNAAALIYAVVKKEGKNENEKLAAVKKYFPTCKIAQFRAASNVVESLRTWVREKIEAREEATQEEGEGEAAVENFRKKLNAKVFGGELLEGCVPYSLPGPNPSTILKAARSAPASSSSVGSTVTYNGMSFAEDEADALRRLNMFGGGGGEEVVDEFWLVSQCQKYVSVNSSSIFNGGELSMTVENLLESNQSYTHTKGALMDLLGADGTTLKFIETVLDHRVEVVHSRLAIMEAEVDAEMKEQQQMQGNTEFIISSRKEKELSRNRQKALRKLRTNLEKIIQMEKDSGRSKKGKQSIQQLDLERMKRFHEAQLMAGPDMTLRPAVDRNESGRLNSSPIPSNAIQKDKETHKEIRVPAPERAESKGQDERIPITVLDDFAQAAFPPYITHLNRMQSKVFDSAYNTNENLLVAAPTGAGKTNVALLTILHACKQFTIDGVLQRDKFKIIYVAPMKALAAEMTGSFGKRLAPLGLIVKELTGDMQLTKKELQETHVIVTTPEKWDVITRKSTDVALTQIVALLIIDEVHLLHSSRGAVLESIVARTLRQVEQTQTMIRIVGLSATLPNYKDVAHFLKVDNSKGLFYFDSSYRPVPLATAYFGVRGNNFMKQRANMDLVCYEEARRAVHEGHQVMIFVHSRKATVTTGQTMLEICQERDGSDIFSPSVQIRESRAYADAARQVSKSRNRELKELFPKGFGMHNAGMLRSDRTLVEKLFAQGFINVLCSTATLAWGVNLPAHNVIIKGTQVYDSGKGGFTDLGILDVQQIFGRAGRPQFDDTGEACIITSLDKIDHYLRLMAHQLPIESSFIGRLADHLNAEIVLGTVTNVREAVAWLSYTYLFVRMLKNPLVYGATMLEKESDPNFIHKRVELIAAAGRRLDKCKMIRYDERGGNFYTTDLGRTASHYYIEHETIELFNRKLNGGLSDAVIFEIVSRANEFEQVKVREDEINELNEIEDYVPLPIRGGVEGDEGFGKVNALLQAYIGGYRMRSFSLISDMNYVAQNAGRIARALFEIAVKRAQTGLALKLLKLGIMIDKKLWTNQHPLRQFGNLSPVILGKLEKLRLSVDKIRDHTVQDISGLLSVRVEAARAVRKAAFNVPRLEIEHELSPITRTIIRVSLTITADFSWNDRIHGGAEPFWIWVTDDRHENMVHNEYFVLQKKQSYDEVKLTFIIPIFADPFPSQYFLHVHSDRWLGSSSISSLSFQNIVLPDHQPPHTDLMPLQPTPIKALQKPKFEALYPFTHFNRVQTQAFFSLYRTNVNVLMGAPTGSGKTICAELAMLKLFAETKYKVVYIGPLKALVSERMKDWKVRFGEQLGKSVLELTGDTTPVLGALEKADIILTTPEKWDGISRNWQQRQYVQNVGLIVMDEIHLLGVERGNILEIIVSRMRYISSQTLTPLRFVGLSTALANPEDLADWLGIDSPNGLFNFHPSVRPVPLRIHLQGYPGKHYCPRMKTMNRPAYAAITLHSPNKSVLIFVSSRRQTRLTALDLMSSLVADDAVEKWVHMEKEELDYVLSKVIDTNLRDTLAFGIGLHHAGLPPPDRAIVEKLFKQNKIQVLCSTSTLAWGVNLPAHLVIIKGTEYFDPKTHRYVDFPVTDVLQMMGRAGRPQYDKEGVAVIMVAEDKKNFYKKFIYEPFPVESSLKAFLHDHINAEICAGTIGSKQDAVDFLTWTYFFRRLEQNPTYYGLHDVTFAGINRFLSDLVDDTLQDLIACHCLEDPAEMEEEVESIFGPEEGATAPGEAWLTPTTMGRVASYYYLNYLTMDVLYNQLAETSSVPEVLEVLCAVAEFDEVPVRHSEDELNEKLAEKIPWAVDDSYDSPHTKANILLQCHFSGIPFPIPDYYGDLKNVLDQALRILQAMCDICADAGWLHCTLNIIALLQMVTQGHWAHDSQLLQLPHMSNKVMDVLLRAHVSTLPQVCALPFSRLNAMLGKVLSKGKVNKVTSVVKTLPLINIDYKLGETKAYEEGILSLTLTRKSQYPKNGIYAPKFPKKKEEGWWLILGNEEGELFALRRIQFRSRTITKLSFDVPGFASDVTGEEDGTGGGVGEDGHCELWLYLMSDSYMGFDQQIPINFTVTEPDEVAEEWEEEYFEEEEP